MAVAVAVEALGQETVLALGRVLGQVLDQEKVLVLGQDLELALDRELEQEKVLELDRELVLDRVMDWAWACLPALWVALQGIL